MVLRSSLRSLFFLSFLLCVSQNTKLFCYIYYRSLSSGFGCFIFFSEPKAKSWAQRALATYILAWEKRFVSYCFYSVFCSSSIVGSTNMHEIIIIMEICFTNKWKSKLLFFILSRREKKERLKGNSTRIGLLGSVSGSGKLKFQSVERREFGGHTIHIVFPTLKYGEIDLNIEWASLRPQNSKL